MRKTPSPSVFPYKSTQITSLCQETPSIALQHSDCQNDAVALQKALISVNSLWCFYFPPAFHFSFFLTPQIHLPPEGVTVSMECGMPCLLFLQLCTASLSTSGTNPLFSAGSPTDSAGTQYGWFRQSFVVFFFLRSPQPPHS